QFACLSRHRLLSHAASTVVASETMKCFVANDSFVTLNRRYVNMTDINFSRQAAQPDSRGAEASPGAARSGELRWDIIELLFFAYRDFVGDADHELEAF